MLCTGYLPGKWLVANLTPLLSCRLLCMSNKIVLCLTSAPLLQAQDVNPYILTNSNGMEAHILSYGAIVQKLLVPDASGVLQDVALGFDQIQPYQVS